MAGDTKLFMMVVKDAVAPFIQRGLWEVPQFAYRANASTVDALLRGSQHCSCVRTALTFVHTDVTSRLIEGDIPMLRGGVMISLDLAKAFDCVPFVEMYHSLREVGVPDNLARLVVEVHRQTVCTIRHAGHEMTVKMYRGLRQGRQGCPLAPSVFAAWTSKLCRRLGVQWSQQHASLFADDVHGFWLIQSVEEFHEARKQIFRLVAQLGECGMEINFGKSVAVLTLRGTAAADIKRRFVQWRGGRYVLVVGQDRGTGKDILLPVEEKMEYLGAILSYGSYETQSLHLRGSRPWANFTKLKPILRTNSVFSSAHRLRVFQACVLPALLYGLTGVGISAPALREIISILARMLRKVLRIHEHGVTNSRVLEMAATDPEAMLRAQLQQKEEALLTDELRAPPLATTALTRTREIACELERIVLLPNSGLIEVDRAAEAVSCSVCGLEFPCARSLDAHYTSQHPHIHKDARASFNRREHTLHGLPHCRLCRTRLYDWASMERRITEGRCPRLKQAAAEGVTMETLMIQIAADEVVSPPPPPVGSRADDGADGDIPPELLRCPLSGARSSPLRSTVCSTVPALWSASQRCWTC